MSLPLPTGLPLYILVGDHAHACDDLLAWAEWMETHVAECIMAKTFIAEIEVSTVFLGTDSYGRGDPLLFETMIFTEDGTGALRRYFTKAEAWPVTRNSWPWWKTCRPVPRPAP